VFSAELKLGTADALTLGTADAVTTEAVDPATVAVAAVTATAASASDVAAGDEARFITRVCPATSTSIPQRRNVE
jgi:hypothetical protein